MKFNLFQKYFAVASKFLNTYIILIILGIDNLGLYAFVLASSNIFASITGLGLRAVFIREFLSKKEDIDKIQFVIFCEILLKISLIFFSIVTIFLVMYLDVDFWLSLSIIFLGVSETSSQMTSQKLRAIGLNTISQLCLNIRPVVISASFLSLYFISPVFLEVNFIDIVVVSYLIPTIFFYLFWLWKYKKLFSIEISYIIFKKNLVNFFPELPGLLAFSFSNKATSRIDVIFISFFLGSTITGMYRLITQLVMVANAAIYPVESHYKNKLAINLKNNDMKQAKKIMTRASIISTVIYINILLIICSIFYLIPFEESLKYQEVFVATLIIASFTGLVRSAVPMLNSYVIFKNQANKGGFILTALVLISAIFHYWLVPIYGIIATSIIVLTTTLLWRLAAMKFI